MNEDPNNGGFPATLRLGAIAFLIQLLAQSEWTSSPKEKLAGGRLKGRLEPYNLSQPDPCLLRRDDPGFNAGVFAANKAIRIWREKVETIVFSPIEKIAATACVKSSANKPGGTDEFFAELQEVFGILE